jgi:hypothetical protein
MPAVLLAEALHGRPAVIDNASGRAEGKTLHTCPVSSRPAEQRWMDSDRALRLEHVSQYQHRGLEAAAAPTIEAR